MILAPLVRKVESADACSTEKESRICGFRAVYVFDISQTDGAPLPTIGVAQGEPGEYFSRLEKLVREQGITLEYSADIAPAKGMSCGKKIVPPGNWFAPPGSNRSSGGGNEAAEASDVEGRFRRLGESAGRNVQ